MSLEYARSLQLRGAASMLLRGRRSTATGILTPFGVEEAALVFPIETRGRDPRIRQPIERDVVEDLVWRQLARRARVRCKATTTMRRLAVGIIMVEEPGREEDGRIRKPI